MTNDSLIQLITEMADDLESYISQEYKSTLAYPSQQKRHDRDMDIVNRARAAIAAMGVTGVQSEASPNRVENASQDQFNSDAPANGRFVNQGDEFARVTMEALDQNITQSEISVVDDLENVYQKVRYRLIRSGNHHPETKADIAYLIAHNIGGIYPVDEMAMLIEGYRTTRKPVSVSLEKCAMAGMGAFHKYHHETAVHGKLLRDKWSEVSKAVLDAAGVKYVD